MGHDTIWRSKRPGEKLSVEMINVSEEMGSGALLINPGGMPDWVRDPYGNKVHVRALLQIKDAHTCGKCGAVLPAGTQLLVADVADDLKKAWFVYSCATDGCGFVWEQRNKPTETPEGEAEKLRAMKEYLP